MPLLTHFLFAPLAARLLTLVGIVPSLAALALAGEPRQPIDLASAKESGVLNLGTSRAEVAVPSDAPAGETIARLAFELQPSSSAGIWSKQYPSELTDALAKTITVRVRATEAYPHLRATVEIKGSAGTQSLSLSLTPEESVRRVPVNWQQIGELSEIVFLVNSPADGPVTTGSVCINWQFDRATWLEAVHLSKPGRLAAVAVMSLVAAALMVASHFICRGTWSSFRSRAPQAPVVPHCSFPSGLFAKDIAFATATVSTITLALGVQWLGTMPVLEGGHAYLMIALAGAAVGQLWRIAAVGRLWTATELFFDALVTGVFAASSSAQALWQAPGQTSDLLALSNAGATAFVLLYHFANAYMLLSSGKHLTKVASSVIVATPYAFGLLLALPSASLAAAIGNQVFGGLLAPGPAAAAYAGRVVLLWGFMEFVCNAVFLTIARRLLTDIRAHAALLTITVAAIAAPWMADLGSGLVALPAALHPFAALTATMLSQGALWALVFMLTGVVLDGIRLAAPTATSILRHARSGLYKGMTFSGIFVAILILLNASTHLPLLVQSHHAAPWLLMSLAGALAMPLLKTIIESFDGSHSFFGRLGRAYRTPLLYLRGLVAGLAAGHALANGFFVWATEWRIIYGFAVGAAVYAGISLARDIFLALRHRGRIRTWRAYLVEVSLGGFVGAGLGFYLDSAQVPIILNKFRLYTSFNLKPIPDEFYPLLSKWGRIELGAYAGGAKLLFNEALKGVIGWGIAAWLFALNRSLLLALFERRWTPLQRIFSREGAAELTDGTIHVLRWGLWMAPIIFTFLRPMPVPTWYNQDGAVRTLFCISNSLTMSSSHFHEWSLRVFMWVLAYDFFRILIWLDHMGLRVATLINLSFLGMDRLDEKTAEFIGPAATGRYIPDGIKRFTTWAPLLIPFYIPVGAEWDWAWTHSEAIQRSSHGLATSLLTMPSSYLAALVFAAIAIVSLLSLTARRLMSSRLKDNAMGDTEFVLLGNTYSVRARTNGEIRSTLPRLGHEVTRPSYQGFDPAGRAFFLAESDDSHSHAWPVVGNYPSELFAKSRIEGSPDELLITNVANGIRTTITIRLVERASEVAAEIWDIRLDNLEARTRALHAVPYLEWVLNAPAADRNHTQYNRLFPELSYDPAINGVLAWHRLTRRLGILAADRPPDGFLTSRVDFIGRAGSIWSPDCLTKRNDAPDAFVRPGASEPCPTFDPIGSLRVTIPLAAHATASLRLLIGCASNQVEAHNWVHRHLRPVSDRAHKTAPSQRMTIGHGSIPPGTPQPYYDLISQGRVLQIHTPFTPRPFDHTMSNALGHVLSVTNRGLHSSASVNAQHNRITTEWADTATREAPSEALYLYDLDAHRWYSPTYLPLRDKRAKYEVAFGVDGTATFQMQCEDLTTELVTFVPPDEPAAVYMLTISNTSPKSKRLRLGAYFEMALADNPENAGPLTVAHDRDSGAIFFENPRNNFRSGPAFAAMSHSIEQIATHRGQFFGSGRSVAHPAAVESGDQSADSIDDEQPIAGLLTTLAVPANGSVTVSVILGQANHRSQADAVIARLRDVARARESLAKTRTWWNDLINTLQVKTSDPEFDGYLHWLKYQALAERIWARKGFYQASGAFGFRDQLQDAVNLIWVDPRLARRQVLLHAAQQFREGDVVHWFFRLQDDRTGFALRSHASDNLLWLAWAAVDYLAMTGDRAIWDEPVPYLTAETPLPPLPRAKDGIGFFPHRSAEEEPLFEHVLRAVDLVLDRRMGTHGLPLIGSGDWNDGLDEIGSEGRGESVWLGLFLYTILTRLIEHVEQKRSPPRKAHYQEKLASLHTALERTWRDDRYLRAIHDDGIEIGIRGSGIWEIDALTAAWAVIANMNPERARVFFDTALRILERDNLILLGWPALREDSKPYLGRSCRYPEGVRENGMYCHGVQWLIKAARLLAERCDAEGDLNGARRYRDTTIRLWRKISPLPHTSPEEIERYGGQPNKQAADMLTAFEPGRMIWNGYTGAAAWMLREAYEGVIGARLVDGQIVLPQDMHEPRGNLLVNNVIQRWDRSPLS